MISLEPNHEDKYVDLYTVNSRCVCLSIIDTSLSLDAGTLELALLSHMKVGGSWYTKCNLFRKLDFEVNFFFVLQVVFLWFISFKMMELNNILLMWQVLSFFSFAGCSWFSSHRDQTALTKRNPSVPPFLICVFTVTWPVRKKWSSTIVFPSVSWQSVWLCRERWVLLSTCNPHPGERCGKVVLKTKIISSPIQFMQTDEMSGHLCKQYKIASVYHDICNTQCSGTKLSSELQKRHWHRVI